MTLQFDKDAFWRALQGGTVPKVDAPKKAKASIAEPEYRLPKEEEVRVTTLVVVKTRCSCGATYTSPNRLFREYYSPEGKLRHWRPLREGEFPSGDEKKIKEVHAKIDFCQSCFLTAGFERLPPTTEELLMHEAQVA